MNRRQRRQQQREEIKAGASKIEICEMIKRLPCPVMAFFSQGISKDPMMIIKDFSYHIPDPENGFHYKFKAGAHHVNNIALNVIYMYIETTKRLYVFYFDICQESSLRILTSFESSSKIDVVFVDENSDFNTAYVSPIDNGFKNLKKHCLQSSNPKWTRDAFLSALSFLNKKISLAEQYEKIEDGVVALN